MKESVHDGTVKVAHLIPSRGRSKLMLKNMGKMRDVWNRKGTFIAIDRHEVKDYREIVDALPEAEFLSYDNKYHNVGMALEILRARGVEYQPDIHVMSDDNCVFTRESFNNIVRVTHAFGGHVGGAHPTAAFFDKSRMRRLMEKKHGVRSFRKMTWILRAISNKWYSQFSYPQDLPCYADRYFSMWLISRGMLNFRCAPDAHFTKTRMIEGGIGAKETRTRSALGLARMCTDFAETMGPHEARIPWELIIQRNQPKLRIKIRRSR